MPRERPLFVGLAPTRNTPHEAGGIRYSDVPAATSRCYRNVSSPAESNRGGAGAAWRGGREAWLVVNDPLRLRLGTSWNPSELERRPKRRAPVRAAAGRRSLLVGRNDGLAVMDSRSDGARRDQNDLVVTASGRGVDAYGLSLRPLETSDLSADCRESK
jgi:hypothetical protein